MKKKARGKLVGPRSDFPQFGRSNLKSMFGPKRIFREGIWESGLL